MLCAQVCNFLGGVFSEDRYQHSIKRYFIQRIIDSSEELHNGPYFGGGEIPAALTYRNGDALFFKDPSYRTRYFARASVKDHYITVLCFPEKAFFLAVFIRSFFGNSGV